MGFCPKCKMEYQDGIFECSDCHVALVDRLLNPNYVTLLQLKSPAVAEKFQKYLQYSNISAASEELDDVIVFSALPKTEPKLRSAWSTFVLMELSGELGPEIKEEEEAFDILHSVLPKQLQKELQKHHMENLSLQMADPAGDETSEDPFSEEDEENIEEVTEALLRTKTGTYESMSKKAEDSYGSAIMLIGFGLVGTVYTLLNILGVLTHFQGLFSLGILLVFFMILFVVGIYTWKQYKIYSQNATEENDLKVRISQWLTDNCSVEKMPEESDTLSPEELDLIRLNWISKELMNNFPDLSEEAATEFAEEFYNSL